MARDPAYARAHAALAEAWMTKAFHATAPPPDLIEKARAAAAEALRLDDTLAEAHGTLGAISFFTTGTGRRPSGRSGARSRSTPATPRPISGTRWVWSRTGVPMKAIAQSRLALELDPLSYAVSNDLAVMLYCARRFDESIAQARRTLEADPKFFPAHAIIGGSLAAQGRYGEAVVELETAMAVSKEPYSYLRGRLAHAYALAGRREDALKLVEQMEAGRTGRRRVALSTSPTRTSRSAITRARSTCWNRRPGSTTATWSSSASNRSSIRWARIRAFGRF